MDSIARIVNCFGNACADAGLPVPPESAMRHVIGLGLAEAVDVLLPGVDNALRERVVARYREHFLHIDQTATPLFDGVRVGLEEFLPVVATCSRWPPASRAAVSTACCRKPAWPRCSWPRAVPTRRSAASEDAPGSA